MFLRRATGSNGYSSGGLPGITESSSGELPSIIGSSSDRLPDIIGHHLMGYWLLWTEEKGVLQVGLRRLVDREMHSANLISQLWKELLLSKYIAKHRNCSSEVGQPPTVGQPKP